MKGLSIEEKAKRYDEAIQRARQFIETPYLENSDDVVGYIFPELKESEGERIKKALLEMVHDTTGDSLWVDYDVHKEDVLAWLEKQGEHANFLSKIQVGDKVTRNEDGVLVNLSKLNRVAKPADKQGEQNSIMNVPAREVILSIWSLGNEWKELTNGSISTVYGTQLDYIQNHWKESEYYLRAKQSEQKPNYCHHEVDLSGCSEEYCKAYYDGWNNCNQQHAQLEAEQKPAWSEEDTKMVESIITDIKYCKKAYNNYSFHENEIGWLKSLKDRVQPKQEWNEEDKRKIDRIYSILRQAADTHAFSTTCRLIGDRECIELQDFLKSLRPQSTWKPSDEQMMQLGWIAKQNAHNILGKELVSLYHDLKNLKDEK